MKRWFFIFFMMVSQIYARQLRIVTPYAGLVFNQLDLQQVASSHPMMDEYIESLKDDALLGGLYFQWVNPDHYQWNVFLYGSRHINYSDIIGSHFIFDYYPTCLPDLGKVVIGAGLDYIRVETKGKISKKLSDFQMILNVYAPYFRIGRYIYFGSQLKKGSVLPWIGYEQDVIRGDVGFKIKDMGGMCINREIKSDYEYAMIGINVRVTLYHFIDLSGKYARKLSLAHQGHLNTFSGMFNLYLNRHWGFSYRLKSMELSVCKNAYHMGGIVYMF